MEIKPKSDEILRKVLEIINYTEDKEYFIQKFLENCHKMALQQLIQNLPEEKKAKIEELSNSPQSPEIISQFRELLAESNYQNDLEKTTTALFSEFLEAIFPTLSDDQKKELNTYLTSL
jgi:hypothetical protein